MNHWTIFKQTEHGWRRITPRAWNSCRDALAAIASTYAEWPNALAVNTDWEKTHTCPQPIGMDDMDDMDDNDKHGVDTAVDRWIP